MSEDRETIAFYNREAEAYAKAVEPEDPPKRLTKFATRLPKGGAVLDLGCGGGWASEAFRELGFDVTAMDASSGMIEKVARLGNIKTICGGFETVDDVAIYDGIWASYSLQHTPRENLPGILGRLSRALRSDGWIYIGIHKGDETMRDDLNRLYVHYNEDELRSILKDVGLDIVSVTFDLSTGYDGRSIECMDIEAQKIG